MLGLSWWLTPLQKLLIGTLTTRRTRVHHLWIILSNGQATHRLQTEPFTHSTLTDLMISNVSYAQEAFYRHRIASNSPAVTVLSSTIFYCWTLYAWCCTSIDFLFLDIAGVSVMLIFIMIHWSPSLQLCTESWEFVYAVLMAVEPNLHIN